MSRLVLFLIFIFCVACPQKPDAPPTGDASEPTTEAPADSGDVKAPGKAPDGGPVSD